MKIFIHYDDQKTQHLKEEGKKLGYEIIPIKGSPILLVIRTVLESIKNGIPEKFFFRYLNDYSNPIKTILRFTSEGLTIAFLRCAGCKIYWICHNVDRESWQFHPRITKIRRNLISRFSSKIYVTDPILVKNAPFEKRKLDSITFGAMYTQKSSKEFDVFLKEVEIFVTNELEKEPNSLFCLCAGRPNWKTEHFELIPKLIERANHTDFPLKFILIGDITDYYEKTNNKKLVNTLKLSSSVLLRDTYIDINEKKIAPFIDFYWRVYRDKSIPTSLYIATSLRIPTITQKHSSILSELVTTFGIGYSLNEDMENLEEVLSLLKSIPKKNVDLFFKDRNWKNSALKLFTTN